MLARKQCLPPHTPPALPRPHPPANNRGQGRVQLHGSQPTGHVPLLLAHACCSTGSSLLQGRCTADEFSLSYLMQCVNNGKPLALSHAVQWDMRQQVAAPNNSLAVRPVVSSVTTPPCLSCYCWATYRTCTLWRR